MSTNALIGGAIPSTDVVKRAARIGAEVKNIKLSGDLPDHTIAAINSLLLEHKVIFFRNQGHLNDAEHAVVGIDVVQLWRNRRQAQALLDDRRRHEMPRGDLLFAHTAIAEDPERAELIEWMQADALVVFRKRVVLGDTAIPDHTGDRLGLRHAQAVCCR